jgi:hypothetical protein
MDGGTRTFAPGEVLVAALLAVVVEIGFFLLLGFAGTSRLHIQSRDKPPPEEIPIAVKPVMDPLPLLKLGGKKVKAKLPDMWKKQAPVKQYEEKSAPSPDAKQTPDAITSAPVATADAEAPPPDAEVVKQVDENLKLIDAGPDAPTVEGAGSPNGVKQGTETDPLKARAVSMYTMKILGWFNARFRPPVGKIPCAELKKLSVGVAANVGGDRSVSGFTINGSSGNPVFDAKVRSTMQSIVGQQLPPPPPLYPDILGSTVHPRFSGAGAKCK